ncbi:hypothetical protein OSCI_3520029 [Kamptonema sp. PCC 6506]|nr:hypothetical protein OSCI_3520029 [Kamptonema sp. PCC 6506]
MLLLSLCLIGGTIASETLTNYPNIHPSLLKKELIVSPPF